MPVHTFNTNDMDWTTHERFSAIRIKPFETRATHPHASMMLVRLAPGGVIPTHLHEVETETIYVLSGQAVLTVDGDTFTVTPDTGGSVVPQSLHSLENTGDVELEMIAIHMPANR
jgi:mannose-6-phosphate isomerase-like protein (cupin superfamily)